MHDVISQPNLRRGVLAACLLALLAVPAGAAPLSISDGTAILTVDDVHGGMLDFELGGTDHLWEASYYYRNNTTSMSLELPLIGPSTTAVTSVTAISATEVEVIGSTANFSFTLLYRLNGLGRLIPTLDVTNISGAALDLSLFNYQDWDVDGTWFGDSIAWNGNNIQQSDSTLISITPFQTPDAVEATVYSTLLDDLTDGNVDDLTDGSGLPFGPGDGTFAFQFNLNLADGGGTTIVYAVPEPATGALAGLGLIGLGWIGRSRHRA